MRHDPPHIGDTITVDYSPTNVGAEPVQLEYTFVGVRDPAGDNRDAEDENEKRTLAVNETIEASGRIFLDTAGQWMLFPVICFPGTVTAPTSGSVQLHRGMSWR